MVWRGQKPTDLEHSPGLSFVSGAAAGLRAAALLPCPPGFPAQKRSLREHEIREAANVCSLTN
jgi:hypothetical protein